MEVCNMNVNTKTMVSISEANQNFSKVARLVDQYGSAVILKNNSPRYLILEFNQADEQLSAQTDDVLAISENLITRNKAVYEELAKLKSLLKNKFYYYIHSL